MLEFSDAPYRFFGPAPSPPLIWLGRQVNRTLVLPGKNHLVPEIRIEGDREWLLSGREKGDRLVFVVNHPTHSDPQVITEVHRRLGVPSCFMAAYDVFLRSRFTGWAMRRLGHFSIDREGSDRKAMATAIETIRDGHRALTIFPEGNVYLTNDRVTPFLDGAAFIALKAQQTLDSGRVKIVPVSLKFTHLTTPRQAVRERLARLGEDSGHRYEPGVKPMEAVLGLGAHLVADRIHRMGGSDGVSINPESPFDSLRTFTGRLVGEVESALSLAPKEGLSLVERIRGVRSAIHQIRIDENRDDHPEIDGLAEKAILALRIHGYVEPYLTERPTVDRYDETVERIAEDYYSKTMPRTGPRRAIVRIHGPLDAMDFFDAARGKLRNALRQLTATMETTVQDGLDAINETNDAPGSVPVHEVK